MPRLGLMQSLIGIEPTPDEKAESIINSVPSSSLFTKTGGVVLGTAVTAAAISTELYVSGYPKEMWSFGGLMRLWV